MSKKTAASFDYILALLVLGLTFFGIIMIYDTSVVVAHEVFNDRFWFLKNQSIWALIGIFLGVVTSKIDYHWWRKLAKPLIVVSIIALVLVLLPGFSGEIYGARRRLVIPTGVSALAHLNLQPSELAKLSLVIYLAAILTPSLPPSRSSLRVFSKLTPFALVVGILAGLVIVEPDLGTSIIIGGIGLLMYFISGANLLEVFLLLGIAILGATTFAFSSEYRRNRLLSFLNPGQDLQGISYHINQALIALGSGGLLGLGLGHSRQKFQYLPEAATDSIFAVIGEELGFIGASLVVVVFIFIILRGMRISEKAPDEFGKLLAFGIVAMIALQTLLNLGSMVALTPLTGVPLPFISYGGSSLTILLVAVGILLNISQARK